VGRIIGMCLFSLSTGQIVLVTAPNCCQDLAFLVEHFPTSVTLRDADGRTGECVVFVTTGLPSPAFSKTC
jgi:hypothetical protein